MSNSTEKILYRKAVLIFEELGFLMPTSDGDIGSPQNCRTAMVAFKGPFSGCLLVSVSSEILPILSSNMLGEQGSSAQTLETDALCEITNIICGNVLPAIYGFKPVFHLDAPELIEDADLSRVTAAYKEVSQTRIGFDAGQAEVRLFADSDAAAPS